MTRILITDDEKDIVNALEIYLKPEGYEIQKAYTGKEAVDAVRQGNIDLVLLDVMMPVMDGLQAMSRIRSFSNVPIILLTAKSEDTDKVLGLNIGADDYITKPFNPAEVIARVRSQLRRYISLGGSQRQGEHVLVNGGLVLNEDAKSLTVDGTAVNLTPIEFGILELLMQNPGKVFSSADIYRQVWNEEAYGSEATIAVHIRHLREKIEITPKEPRYIKVVWGLGYKMEKENG
ncbi:MAG: response regulator transcription factor [Galactobacillus timonensis]|uniref:response regulator transcription factor n=1 Tax=Galactobacillus timonensis TaxID=2041840 RepID=UPI0015B4269B|nr:response regulator transcription factor [Galactobacillus timonensis]MDD5851352.1 response regulator transcription factor [Galactobacillus timonensis]MDD6369819.1 response regulator transcription factor [Galactobacillus timonensis]MDD6600178.1 response regulator transcription factor [Galactobacillus timonensis]MDD6679742.1 response regulator transcription factor [Galactobacillus timonensis]